MGFGSSRKDTIEAFLCSDDGPGASSRDSLSVEMLFPAVAQSEREFKRKSR